jgi:hypothetical protein
MAKQNRSYAKAPEAKPGNSKPLRSYLVDPNVLNLSHLGTRPQDVRHVGFYTLREMARVTQPVTAIIRTRQNQVARFAKLPRYQGDIGVQVRMRDPEAKPTKADKKRMRELEDIVLRCGVAPDPGRLRRPGLDPLLRMMVEDSLTLDAMALELRYDRKDRLFDWWAVDGATVRLTVPSYTGGHTSQTGPGIYGLVGEGYGGVGQARDAVIQYVQLWQGAPVAEYTADEMAYWVRNPRTALESNGYGQAELESLIEVVVGYLNAMLYNQRYFTHSSIPEGVLSVTGQYTAENLDDFRRYWNAMVSGVNNAWRVPILASKDGKGVTWTALKGNNKEMQFHEWLDFLTTIACAVFQIDREELGLSGRGAGDGGASLSEGGNGATLAHSMSKGLHPLLTRIESGINDDLFPRLEHTEDFLFTWAGLDPDQEDKRIERETKLLQAGVMTVNEIRAGRDLKGIESALLWGDAPANTTLYQAWAMGMQAKMQAEGQGGGDDAGDGGDGDAPADGQAPGGDGQPGADAKGGPPAALPKVNPDGSEEPDDEAGGGS